MLNPKQLPGESVKFSPLIVHAIVLTVLRYFFKNCPREELRWSEDPKESNIVIETVNNIINKDNEIQKKPRILFSRGAYTIQKTSLTGDLVDGKAAVDTYGLKHSSHMNLVGGQISIIIEAYEEGVCELLADMVATFFTWSSDHICNTYRFKKFGYPLFVQECTLDEENKEKFKIVVSTEYLTETSWELREDAIKLKGLYLDLQRNILG